MFLGMSSAEWIRRKQSGDTSSARKNIFLATMEEGEDEIMNVNQNTFKKGDWIVHAFYGIGQIVGKAKMKISGELRTFITVKIKDGRYWLSKDNTNIDYIRPLASPNEIFHALTVIRKRPQELPEDYREKKAKILETMEDGSLLSNAQLIRDLHAKKLTSKLSKEERSWLKKLKNQFVYEWSLVYGENKRTAERRMRKALKLSITKRTN